MKKTEDIKVFISTQNSTCGECDEELGKSAWILLNEDKGALCLTCADLDHLVFLPAGDAALTRRSKKYSELHAVVLKWNRSRKHYERQGLLIEESALDQAERDCLEDSEFRELQRQRGAERREILDQKYIEEFQGKLRQIFPGCSAKRAQKIAEHACLKYSGRVGRSASAKNLDEKMIELAVAAHIRHTETNYDELLASGVERHAARKKIRNDLEKMLEKWRQTS